MDGNVGLGTNSPSNILTVVQGSGNDPIADAWTTYSSRRWKTDIRPVEQALDKLKRLRGVSFQWNKDGKHDIGMIAEEVGEVIPEVMAYEEDGQDAKSVDYPRLVAVLIHTTKEQQKIIEHQEANLAQTNAQLNQLKREVAKLELATQRLSAVRLPRENVGVTGASSALSNAGLTSVR